MLKAKTKNRLHSLIRAFSVKVFASCWFCRRLKGWSECAVWSLLLLPAYALSQDTRYGFIFHFYPEYLDTFSTCPKI